MARHQVLAACSFSLPWCPVPSLLSYLHVVPGVGMHCLLGEYMHVEFWSPFSSRKLLNVFVDCEGSREIEGDADFSEHGLEEDGFILWS